MPAPEVPSVGERIRAERLNRAISLRALAREVGVSASMISQIENGKAQPSVSTLYAITSALGISVHEVFEPAPAALAEPAPAALAEPAPAALAEPAPAALAEPAPAALAEPALTALVEPALTAVVEPALIAADEPTPVALAVPRPTTVLQALGAARELRLGPLVRPSERQVLTLDSGVTWERLGALPSHQVDFLRVTYAPGGTSSSTGDLMRHAGSEYGYLLSGELVLTLGFEDVTLHAGDAISFDSTTPHRYRNDGTEPAVGLWWVVES